MYNVKLDPDDFNSAQMRSFSGDMVYAQNKRQQVVMAERMAERNPSIYFGTWHPGNGHSMTYECDRLFSPPIGWVDTPAVRTSMPSFYSKMQNKLRTPEQGADTLVWLCCLKDISKRFPNGEFFQDRAVVSKHLPLAWTKSNLEEDERFMRNLDRVYEKYVR